MKSSGCPFCHNLEPQLASNHHAFSILDSRPVSPGHSLVISRNHAPTVFDLPPLEYAACFELVRELRELLVQKWKTKSLSVVMNSEQRRIKRYRMLIFIWYPGIEMWRCRLPQTFGLP